MTTETTELIATPTVAGPARRLRKLLVVAYYFPPAGDVGIHRTLRFIKWLPHFGYQPVVLTTQNGKVQSIDRSMLERTADVEVHRTYSPEKLNYGISIDGAADRPLPRLVERVFREIPRDARQLLAVPDEKRGWIRHAVREGERLIRSHGIDAVYVSGKPFSSYFIGERLGRRFGLPWIMDLRDLWTLNQRNHTFNPWREWMERRQERRLVQSAAAVIANTPDNRNDFIAAYPQCRSKKFIAVTNGYDKDEFSRTTGQKHDKFTIAYSGAFYFFARGKSSLYRRLMGLDRRKSHLLETYSPIAFFEALKQLFAEQPETRGRIEVQITGTGSPKAQMLVDRFGLHDTVKILGWLDYEESLEVLKRAHACLIVLSRGRESKGWIPSKLFQYLGSGNPLLAMVPDGDVKEIVEKTRSGVVVEPDDVTGAKAALHDMYRRYFLSGETYAPRWDLIEQYESWQLTKRLADCLDAVCSKAAPRP